MANSLTSLQGKILARGLRILRSRLTMVRLVNSDLSPDAAQKGDTINIPLPTSVGIRPVVPSVIDPTPEDKEIEILPVKLDRWYQTDPVHLTDKELTEINARQFYLPTTMEAGMNSLVEYVNQTVHEQYVDDDRGIYGVVGTPGVTPFGAGVGTMSAAQARMMLNIQKAPKSDRFGMLDYMAGAQALALPEFSDAEKVGDDVVKIEGEIGRKFGLQWVEDDAVVYHTAGTIDNGGEREALVNNVGGYPADTRIINVDATAVTGTIVRGDIVQFSGHDQTYVVVSNEASAQFDDTEKEYTFAGNAISGLRLYPALKEPVEDNEVMTVLESHRVNLAGHRDAFVFVARTLADGASELMAGAERASVQTMADAATGIPLRLEIKRQHKQYAWEFDKLWGTKLVRPELAVRILG